MSSPVPRAPTLYGIILIKIVKGVVFLMLALGVFAMVGQHLGDELDHFLRWVHLDPEMRFFSNLGDRLDRITPDNVRWVASGSLLYGLLSLAEGVGLIFRLKWVGMVVVFESALLIPFELYKLRHGFSAILLLVLAVNVAIVWYLFQNRDRLFRHHEHPVSPPAATVV